jgi:hypothetical protein
VLSDSVYDLKSRLLHRLALGSTIVGQACFDLECALCKPDTEIDTRHVFVTGLARAGTTIVMRKLYQSHRFRSLTYRDMPFIMMPGVWKRLSAGARKAAIESERAHGDRLSVSFDSPEAFDEVFWRTFCQDDYIKDDRLIAHAATDDVKEQFSTFFEHVISSGGGGGGGGAGAPMRYLSKNNNNVLRMPTIKSALPDAVFVIPFRDPSQQAASLLNQHRRFCALHGKDAFTRQYMTWLGHHEFGSDHRPFRLANVADRLDEFEIDDINYWLALWNMVYQSLKECAPAGSLFVSYEELCADPVTHLRALCRAVDVPAPDAFEIKLAAHRDVFGAEAKLLSDCDALYAELSARSLLGERGSEY